MAVRHGLNQTVLPGLRWGQVSDSRLTELGAALLRTGMQLGLLRYLNFKHWAEVERLVQGALSVQRQYKAGARAGRGNDALRPQSTRYDPASQL